MRWMVCVGVVSDSVVFESVVVCMFGAFYTLVLLFFFFNDTATTEIYTLSLHDALPISHKLVYLNP